MDNGGEVGSYGRPYQAFNRKLFRRRRKFEGKGIDAELAARVEQAQRADRGLLCRGCGKWRGWKDIFWKYSLHEGLIVRTWFCYVCGNQLKEDEL